MGELVNRRVNSYEFGEGTIIQHLTAEEQHEINGEGIGEILVLFDDSHYALHDAVIGTLQEVLDKYPIEERFSKCWFFSDDFHSNKLTLMEE